MEGLASQNADHEYMPWDAIELLKPCLPTEATIDEYPGLKNLLGLASQTTYALSQEERRELERFQTLISQSEHSVSDEDKTKFQELEIIELISKRNSSVDVQVLRVIANLIPSLEVLAMIAERSIPFWSGLVKQGGKAPDGPRHLLMNRLAGVYIFLFSRRPSITVTDKPGDAPTRTGKSITWFRAVFETIESRSADQPGTEPLKRIAASAHDKSDAIPNWIMDALVELKNELLSESVN